MDFTCLGLVQVWHEEIQRVIDRDKLHRPLNELGFSPSSFTAVYRMLRETEFSTMHMRDVSATSPPDELWNEVYGRGVPYKRTLT